MTLTSTARNVLIAALVSSIALSALPSVARSQSSVPEQPAAEAALPSTQAPAPVPPAQPAYKFESIPGNEVIGDFILGPGKVELQLKPGESRTVELSVTNRTGEARDFNFEVEDVTGTSDGSRSAILLGSDRGPYTLREYLKTPTQPIRLEHAQRVRVPVTISIPADAEPGGRYGSVLVNTVSRPVDRNDTGAAPQSPIVARVGTLFFITIEGDVERSGELRDFSTIPDKSWFQGGPIHFSILYENLGSIHVNPYGELRVTNMFGEEVGFVELDPWFALPKSLRFREVIWDREFLLGRYTATVHINRGYDNIIDTMETSFWVIPWKIAAGAFLVLFIVFYLFRLFFRTFEFKKKSR